MNYDNVEPWLALAAALALCVTYGIQRAWAKR